METKPENFYDVIVIGAGPAGTAAAITLGKNLNFKILIVDKENAPIDKVCGDALTGDSLRCLQELQLLGQVRNKGHVMNNIDLYPFGSKAHFSLDSEIITLQRSELSSILTRKVVLNSNCHFKQLFFKGEIRSDGKNYQVDFLEPFSDSPVTFSCAYLIIAIGCQNDKCVYTLRSIPYRPPDGIAYRGYYRAKWNITAPTAYFFYFTRKGYFWVFPMKDGFFNVGCGFDNSSTKTDLKKVLSDNIEKLNKEFGTQGEWEEAPKGAMLRSGLKDYQKLSYGNVLFAGESVASTYPFTGEGIGKALESGIIGGESILEAFRLGKSASEVYNKHITEKLLPYYKPYFSAKNIFTNRLFSTIAFALICKNTRIQKVISNIISEKSLPHDFSLSKKLLQVLVKKKKK